ncbi:hypothetical protein HZH68_014151 [Vespula germanica]|uniref:Uncharacterized protein n=1 Tax=Vespula germanica TaxID=30212 RepID=A0A834JCH2_VESGE|nr:hypothetical protein HZH68_014151 [Vespula germanica]
MRRGRRERMKNKEEEEEEEEEDEEEEEEEEEVSQRHIRILRELNSGSVSFERRQCPDQRSLRPFLQHTERDR